jgi:hypothetical protein
VLSRTVLVVGFLDRFLGRDIAPQSVRVADEGQGTHALGRLAPLPQDNFMKVVGESYYQDALRSLARLCVPGIDGRPSFPATLVPEPDNPHDRNAIAVHGATGKIGHLPREDAVRYAHTFASLREAGYDGGSCTGLLNGGDRDRPSYGVVLALAYPEVCEVHLGISPDPRDAGAGRLRSTTAESGKLRGKHYSSYTEEVKALRRHRHDDSAERLLLELVDVIEAEASQEGWGVAPWYYEQLAVIYRKRKDPEGEVAILERYASAPHAPGVGPEKLRQRLQMARQLAAQARQAD